MRVLGFDRTEKVLLAFIGLGLLAALWAGWLRHRVEAANRQVEIVVDGRELLELCDIAGLSAEKAALRLKQAGATTLAANETTLSELEARGEVKEASILRPFLGSERRLLIRDRALAEKVQEALEARFPGIQIRRFPPFSPGSLMLSSSALGIRGDWKHISEAGLFLDTEQVKAAKAAGLRLVARLPNTAASQPRAIEHSLRHARQGGAHLVIFDEEEVLGYDGLIDYTAAEMKRNRLTYGWVELAEQRGEEEMRRLLWDRLIRVHGISQKEMPKMTLSRLLSRFVRAVREREIRACYARLFLRPEKDVLGYNADYLAELGRRLKEAGFALGEAKPYPSLDIPRWALLLLRLGVAAAAALLAGRVLPVRSHGQTALFLFLFLSLLAVGRMAPLLARQAGSLVAALTFPTLGLVVAWQGMRSGLESSEFRVQSSEKKNLNRQLSTLNSQPFGSAQGKLSTLLKAAGLTVGVSLFSLVGGLFVGGMLTETRFMVGAEQFRGVKLLLLGPAFLIALVLLCGLSRPLRGAGEWSKQVRESARAFLWRPALMLEVGVFLLGLAALGVLLMRSGNVPPGGAPGLEHRARELLETAFWARPRIKEFLLGHPALVIFFLFWLKTRERASALHLAHGRLGWGDALLAAAAIGQASLVDTFCHVHTPLVVSLVRTANGLWLGVLFGVFLAAIWLAAKRGRNAG